MLKKKLLLFLTCFYFSALHGQNLAYEKYTSKNGLVSDRITAIAQDEKGFMWFGSYFGISHYDGNKFEKIDLPAQQKNKYVNCLLSAHGKMYAGFLFGGGLAEYDNGKVKAHFNSEKGASNEFISMTDDGSGGLVLVANTGDIYAFRNGRFKLLTTLPLKPGIFSRQIQKDRSGRYWITAEQGLFILAPPYQTAKLYFKNEFVYSLSVQNNEIWFCRTNGKRTLIQKTKSDPLQAQLLYSSPHMKPVLFSGMKAAGFWQLDFQKGLLDLSSAQKTFYKIPLDLTTDINCIFEDREGNVWIANEPGVFKISNFNIKTYLFEETAAGGGALSFQNDSILWASNSKALYTIAGNTMSKNFKHPGRYDYYALIHFDRQKNLWLGYWEGSVFKTGWKNGELVYSRDFSNFKGKPTKAKTVTEDSKGNLWMAGSNGLYHVKDHKIIDTFHPPNINGQPSFINSITIDESNRMLWLGDNALGVIGVKYELLPDGKSRYQTKVYITAKDGLKDEFIRSVFFDANKTLWAGTRFGGIYKIENRNGKYIVTDCNREAGLSCTRVTDIKAEGTNAVWFATCDGIYRYSHETKLWSHFNTSDGLLNAEVYSVAVDPGGQSVWALSAQGVTQFQTDTKKKSVPPLINLTSISVLGKTDSNAFLQRKRVQYSSSQNSIGFSFAGASFIDEKRVSYKYILEGYDEEWNAPSMNNSVQYASLPAGKYSFKVIAANAKGEWSTEPAVFEFEIVVPFYKRTWFFFLSFSVLVLIVYFIRVQRLKQKYKIEKLRLNIARDLHDDIGSTLGSINILTKTAARKLNKQVVQEEMSPIFEKIGRSAEDTLDAMDDIVWSINPDKDKLEDLIIRMREFVIPLFEAKNIEVDFVAEGNKEQVLPMNFRRNVFLIYKEAVHNILKHSQATDVKIRLQTGHQFVMKISDSGKGFVDEPTQRNGLKNMHNRAKEVSGDLRIHSSSSGTELVFTASIR